MRISHLISKHLLFRWSLAAHNNTEKLKKKAYEQKTSPGVIPEAEMHLPERIQNLL